MTFLDAESVGAISVETTGGWRVLCLVGEIDGAVVTAFSAAGHARPVPVDAIDASRATFLTASGVRLLVAWAQKSTDVTGRRPALVHPARKVRRVLELTSTYDMFEEDLPRSIR
jgi:anti-anti-sigma regulatory factor